MTRGGSFVDFVLAEALLKNCLSDKSNSFTIDKNDLYSALKSDEVSTPPANRMHEGRPFLSLYNEYGYIPSDISDTYSVTRTLENAAADFSISLVATSLNDSTNAQIYLQKSENWRNLFTTSLNSTLSPTGPPSTAFPIPRLSNGTYQPQNSTSISIGRDSDTSLAALGLYEATPWTYSIFVPQNIPALISLTARLRPETRYLLLPQLHRQHLSLLRPHQRIRLINPRIISLGPSSRKCGGAESRGRGAVWGWYWGYSRE